MLSHLKTIGINPLKPNYVTIADDHFRAFLKQEIPEAFNRQDEMDANHELVKKTMDLTVTAQGIRSLDEIAFFTSLTGLYCEKNKLTHLDLRKNLTLRRIWCSSNQLKTLQLSKTTYLETLDCSDNQLTRLELGENTNIKLLHCQNNALSKLDLTGASSILRLIIKAGERVGGVKKNTIRILKINNTMKLHPEVKEAKAAQDASIVISTHRSDGTVLCPDYDPISGHCNDGRPL